MKNQILDDADEIENEDFTQKSFQYAIYTFSLFGGFIFLELFIKMIFIPKSVLQFIAGVFVIAFLFFQTKGFRFALKSIRDKEKNNFKKILGIIGNSLWLVLIITMIYAVFSDIQRIFL